MKIIFSLLLSIVFFANFTGCSRKSIYSTTAKSKKIKNKNFINSAKQQYLSVPAGYKITKQSESKKTDFENKLFVYYGPLNYNQVVDFYTKELEISGWSYSNLSTNNEGMFSACNDSRICVISIRPTKEHSSTIHIFFQDKQKSLNSQDTDIIDICKINNQTTRKPK